jgi:hypothetical protein
MGFVPNERASNQMMSMAEIEAKYHSEWVLIEDPQTNDTLQVQWGKVRHHSKDRDEVYRQAVALRPKRFAMVYVGAIPADTAIII